MNKIRYVEYNTSHPGDFCFDVPEGHDCWLLLLTHNRAKFWVDGTLQECPAGYAVLYAPGQKIYYHAVEDHYSDDWLRFESDEPFVTSGFSSGKLFSNGQPFSYGTPFPVTDFEYCHQLMRMITWEHASPQGNSSLLIAQLLPVLFTKLQEAVNTVSQNRYTDALCTLQKEIYRNPQEKWTVKGMAAHLHISAGYLQIIYKEQFGLSCMEDVIQSRIQRAKHQLAYTNYSLAEISSHCGYESIEHFCRQFKKYTGYTPRAYNRLYYYQSTIPGRRQQ